MFLRMIDTVNGYKKFIAILGILPVILFASSGLCAEKKHGAGAHKGPPPAKGVQVTAVKSETIRETASIIGSLEPPRISRIGTEINGIVEKVFVAEGDKVGKGKPLIRLSNSQLKISLVEAMAEEEEAYKNLLTLKAGSRPQEIKEAEAAMEESESLWKMAVKEYGRYKKLYEEGVIDERLKTNSRLEAQAAERAFLRKKFSHELALEGTRKEVIAKAEATVNVKKARVSLYKDQLKKTTIYSPFGGIVTEKFVEKGEWVTTGQQVCRVLQINPIRVTLPVPETIVSRIRLGAEVDVQLDAFPDRIFIAKVFQIIPVADKGSRTFPVRLHLENRKGLLMAGMMVRGIIPFGEAREALVVPQDAVTIKQGGKSVFVVDGNNMAKLVSVKTGLLQKGMIEVEGDLVSGDLVVTRGGERLRPGTLLKILNPGVVDLFHEKANKRNRKLKTTN